MSIRKTTCRPWPAVMLLVLSAGLRSVEALPADSVARDAVMGTVDGWSDAMAAGALLPRGTTVDAVSWVENVVHIDLTLPPDGATAFELTPTTMHDLAEGLIEPFGDDDEFGGGVVRVRIAPSEPYCHLEEFVRYNDRAAPEATATPADRSDRTGTDPDRSVTIEGPLRAGPVIDATGQPAGALSGVTVFCSGGHGWTAATSSWVLQRPVLWTMNEDHGNLDQLNYFVHYAFNAGATVVPFRPVGYQTNEVVLDNDDPGVTYTGTWAANTSNAKYYENNVTASTARYRSSTAGVTETAVARFTPTIPETGFYPVYGNAIPGTNRVPQTYRISHSAGVASVVVDHRNVGGGWVYLGEYYLEAGGDNWVEISNQSAVAGAAIADAIRWGNGIGDVSRPGPDSVSGYTREEECSRYWAHKELGDNSVGYTDTDIWDSSGIDQDDNVSTASRWSREMNQVPAGGVQSERYKRIYLEFHTNASGGAARGCIGLISDSAPTTNQATYATMMADEVDADMLLLDGEFEHTWFDRGSPTFTSAYGAISTVGNGNEFDATIIELAFHDNQTDAELLRDNRVRAAFARACAQGMIRFLNSLAGSTVPLAFPPDTPRNFRVEDLGSGNVKLTWIAPLADAARGGAATGYVVYESTNGYGYTRISTLGNVLTTTLPGIPTETTRYYRIAATNAGGQSMPSETLAVRRPATGTTRNLVVSAFDRLRRQQNPTQDVGGTIERQQWRGSNSFDYIVQHANALEAAGESFASCSNESVIDNQISLDNYDVVVWIAGEESTEDDSFNGTEQARVTTFLTNGGGIFVSGAEIGWDLVGQAGGATFYQNTLRATHVGDDSNTFEATGVAGSILAGIGPFDFDPANGAPYVVGTPDRVGPGTGGSVCLNYVGGTGDGAGVQVNAGGFRTVVFGFPFETITSESVRGDVMNAVVDYLKAVSAPLTFDFNNDHDVDLGDYATMVFCFQGPAVNYGMGTFCLKGDGDADTNVDLRDMVLFQRAFTGPQ